MTVRRRPDAPRRLPLAVLLGAALVLGPAACGDGGDDDASGRATSAPTTTAVADPSAGDGGVALGEGWEPAVGGRTRLAGFGEAAVTITAADGETCEVCLLTATTTDQRARGLMEVTDPDLGGYDGMLFEYDEDASGGFWMRNTPMPLSIAYFDAERTLVSATDMAPCDDVASCPTYPPEGPFRYALELPDGGLDELLVADGSTFRIDGRTCPAADRA
ncbi:MAG TPA: DUF192 domain-containing protein [Aquihabitans sp.]|nr:DUF192 domain-containing protein [Aquihabitans sp.]